MPTMVATARTTLLLATLLGPLGLVGGCKKDAAASAGTVTPSGRRTKPREQLDAAVQRMLDAMAARDTRALEDWMTPGLRSRLPPHSLARALRSLHRDYGEPRGILEEQRTFEGDLTWHSALVLYASGSDPVVLTPVLVQFALGRGGGLDRLLIREHWLIEQVKHPAEAYVPVTRFHLPSVGEWYVLHGGRERATIKHHGSKHQRYAYDLVVKKNGRQRARGSKRHDNRSFFAHGVPLLAPAGGTVVHAINDVPENTPPETGRGGGNGLIIDHGFGEYSALWHAIPGSLTVREGDRVEAGQVVARVGNSGRSTGPHIHFHVSYRPDGYKEAFGLPAPLVDVYVDGVWFAERMPLRGEFVTRAIEGTPSAPPPDLRAAGPRVILSL